MEYYAGMDVSEEATSVCVIDGRGKVVSEAKVATDPSELARHLMQFGVALLLVGLEAGALTPWLAREMAALGLPVVVIETRRMKAYAKASAVKTDRRDAKMIAQALRAGLYQGVHVKGEEAHKRRLVLSARSMLLGQARRLQVKIRGDLKPFGIRLGKVGAGGFAGRVKERLHARPDLMALVAPLLVMRAALLQQVRAYDREIKRSVATDPVCRRLMTAPGVGPITAFAYRATVDDPQRFARSSDVPALFGLVPRIDKSGEHEHIGSISKAGDTMMRSLLFEAANALLTRTRKSFALKRWGLKVARRRGMNRARVAVARRLAVILHRMWIDGTDFRLQEVEKPATVGA
jgi:transposase